MITYRSKRPGGFTMIETVIVIAIGASVIIAIALLVYNFNKISAYNTISARSSGSATAIMREIESLVLPANAVLQTHTFPNASYTSTADSLVLEIPSIDISGNIIASTYDYAAFYIVGTTNLYRVLQPNALSARVSGTKLLSSTLSSLTITYNDMDFTKVSVATVDIQTQANAKKDILTDRRREQIRLRNH